MIWEIDEQEKVVDGVDDRGRPDPAYAQALGLVRAPFGRRALAFVVDLALWIVVQLPLWIGALPLLVKLATGSISPYGFVNHSDFVLAAVLSAISAALMLVCAVVQWLLHGMRGTTIGKAVTGIRSVNVRTLERPGIGAVLLRFLIVGASGILPGIGPAVVLLSSTFDTEQRGRGWHDRATRVWLVDVRRGLNPYDEKRMRIARKTVKAEPVHSRAELPSLATRRDPVAQPEYRPGNRISAGVVGAVRTPDPASGTPVAPVPTPAASPAPAPAPAASPAPAPAPAPTPVPAPAPAPAAPAPAAPAPAPIPAPAALALRFDTGETVVVDRAVLIGRNPDAAAHPDARAVSLPDTTRTLSKTHALLRPVEGGIEIVDLRSTNGCAVRSGGEESEIPAGGSAAAHAGDTVRLGDRTAEIVRT